MHLYSKRGTKAVFTENMVQQIETLKKSTKKFIKVAEYKVNIKYIHTYQSYLYVAWPFMTMNVSTDFWGYK